AHLAEARCGRISVSEVEIPRKFSPWAILRGQQHAISVLGVAILDNIRLPLEPPSKISVTELLPGSKRVLNSQCRGPDVFPCFGLADVFSGIGPAGDHHRSRAVPSDRLLFGFGG